MDKSKMVLLDFEPWEDLLFGFLYSMRIHTNQSQGDVGQNDYLRLKINSFLTYIKYFIHLLQLISIFFIFTPRTNHDWSCDQFPSNLHCIVVAMGFPLSSMARYHIHILYSVIIIVASLFLLFVLCSTILLNKKLISLSVMRTIFYCFVLLFIQIYLLDILYLTFLVFYKTSPYGDYGSNNLASSLQLQSVGDVLNNEAIGVNEASLAPGALSLSASTLLSTFPAAFTSALGLTISHTLSPSSPSSIPFHENAHESIHGVDPIFQSDVGFNASSSSTPSSPNMADPEKGIFSTPFPMGLRSSGVSYKGNINGVMGILLFVIHCIVSVPVIVLSLIVSVLYDKFDLTSAHVSGTMLHGRSEAFYLFYRIALLISMSILLFKNIYQVKGEDMTLGTEGVIVNVILFIWSLILCIVQYLNQPFLSITENKIRLATLFFCVISHVFFILENNFSTSIYTTEIGVLSLILFTLLGFVLSPLRVRKFTSLYNSEYQNITQLKSLSKKNIQLLEQIISDEFVDDATNTALMNQMGEGDPHTREQILREKNDSEEEDESLHLNSSDEDYFPPGERDSEKKGNIFQSRSGKFSRVSSSDNLKIDDLPSERSDHFQLSKNQKGLRQKFQDTPSAGMDKPPLTKSYSPLLSPNSKIFSSQKIQNDQINIRTTLKFLDTYTRTQNISSMLRQIVFSTDVALIFYDIVNANFHKLSSINKTTHLLLFYQIILALQRKKSSNLMGFFLTLFSFDVFFNYDIGVNTIKYSLENADFVDIRYGCFCLLRRMEQHKRLNQNFSAGGADGLRTTTSYFRHKQNQQDEGEIEIYRKCTRLASTYHEKALKNLAKNLKVLIGEEKAFLRSLRKKKLKIVDQQLQEKEEERTDSESDSYPVDDGPEAYMGADEKKEYLLRRSSIASMNAYYQQEQKEDIYSNLDPTWKLRFVQTLDKDILQKIDNAIECVTLAERNYKILALKFPDNESIRKSIKVFQQHFNLLQENSEDESDGETHKVVPTVTQSKALSPSSPSPSSPNGLRKSPSPLVALIQTPSLHPESPKSLADEIQDEHENEEKNMQLLKDERIESTIKRMTSKTFLVKVLLRLVLLLVLLYYIILAIFTESTLTEVANDTSNMTFFETYYNIWSNQCDNINKLVLYNIEASNVYNITTALINNTYFDSSSSVTQVPLTIQQIVDISQPLIRLFSDKRLPIKRQFLLQRSQGGFLLSYKSTEDMVTALDASVEMNCPFFRDGIRELEQDSTKRFTALHWSNSPRSTIGGPSGIYDMNTITDCAVLESNLLSSSMTNSAVGDILLHRVIYFFRLPNPNASFFIGMEFDISVLQSLFRKNFYSMNDLNNEMTSTINSILAYASENGLDKIIKLFAENSISVRSFPPSGEIITSQMGLQQASTQFVSNINNIKAQAPIHYNTIMYKDLITNTSIKFVTDICVGDLDRILIVLLDYLTEGLRQHIDSVTKIFIVVLLSTLLFFYIMIHYIVYTIQKHLFLLNNVDYGATNTPASRITNGGEDIAKDANVNTKGSIISSDSITRNNKKKENNVNRSITVTAYVLLYLSTRAKKQIYRHFKLLKISQKDDFMLGNQNEVNGHNRSITLAVDGSVSSFHLSGKSPKAFAGLNDKPVVAADASSALMKEKLTASGSLKASAVERLREMEQEEKDTRIFEDVMSPRLRERQKDQWQEEEEDEVNVGEDSPKQKYIGDTVNERYELSPGFHFTSSLSSNGKQQESPLHFSLQKHLSPLTLPQQLSSTPGDRTSLSLEPTSSSPLKIVTRESSSSSSSASDSSDSSESSSDSGSSSEDSSSATYVSVSTASARSIDSHHKEKKKEESEEENIKKELLREESFVSRHTPWSVKLIKIFTGQLSRDIVILYLCISVTLIINSFIIFSSISNMSSVISRHSDISNYSLTLSRARNRLIDIYYEDFLPFRQRTRGQIYNEYLATNTDMSRRFNALLTLSAFSSDESGWKGSGDIIFANEDLRKFFYDDVCILSPDCSAETIISATNLNIKATYQNYLSEFDSGYYVAFRSRQTSEYQFISAGAPLSFQISPKDVLESMDDVEGGGVFLGDSRMGQNSVNEKNIEGGYVLGSSTKVSRLESIDFISSGEPPLLVNQWIRMWTLYQGSEFIKEKIFTQGKAYYESSIDNIITSSIIMVSVVIILFLFLEWRGRGLGKRIHSIEIILRIIPYNVFHTENIISIFQSSHHSLVDSITPSQDLDKAEDITPDFIKQ